MLDAVKLLMVVPMLVSIFGRAYASDVRDVERARPTVWASAGLLALGAAAGVASYESHRSSTRWMERSREMRRSAAGLTDMGLYLERVGLADRWRRKSVRYQHLAGYLAFASVGFVVAGVLVVPQADGVYLARGWRF